MNFLHFFFVKIHIVTKKSKIFMTYRGMAMEFFLIKYMNFEEVWMHDYVTIG